jgi:hypothetical protein
MSDKLLKSLIEIMNTYSDYSQNKKQIIELIDQVVMEIMGNYKKHKPVNKKKNKRDSEGKARYEDVKVDEPALAQAILSMNDNLPDDYKSFLMETKTVPFIHSTAITPAEIRISTVEYKVATPIMKSLNRLITKTATEYYYEIMRCNDIIRTYVVIPDASLLSIQRDLKRYEDHGQKKVKVKKIRNEYLLTHWVSTIKNKIYRFEIQFRYGEMDDDSHITYEIDRLNPVVDNVQLEFQRMIIKEIIHKIGSRDRFKDEKKTLLDLKDQLTIDDFNKKLYKIKSMILCYD